MIILCFGALITNILLEFLIQCSHFHFYALTFFSNGMLIKKSIGYNPQIDYHIFVFKLFKTDILYL